MSDDRWSVEDPELIPYVKRPVVPNPDDDGRDPPPPGVRRSKSQPPATGLVTADEIAEFLRAEYGIEPKKKPGAL